MPGLTVTEKQHWKDRIGVRIDKRIAAIEAEDPNLMERIEKEAYQRALESLGLAQMQAELDEVEREQQALVQRERDLQRAMLAQVRGAPPETIDHYSASHHHGEVHTAVSRRQTVFEDQLLAENVIGQRILALRRERDDLLDTVWLATSPAQVKTLWSRVSELLGDTSTALQQAALAIPPLDGGNE